jgi:hypothetical protein
VLKRRVAANLLCLVVRRYVDLPMLKRKAAANLPVSGGVDSK